MKIKFRKRFNLQIISSNTSFLQNYKPFPRSITTAWSKLRWHSVTDLCVEIWACKNDMCCRFSLPSFQCVSTPIFRPLAARVETITSREACGYMMQSRSSSSQASSSVHRVRCLVQARCIFVAPWSCSKSIQLCVNVFLEKMFMIAGKVFKGKTNDTHGTQDLSKTADRVVEGYFWSSSSPSYGVCVPRRVVILKNLSHSSNA